MKKTEPFCIDPFDIKDHAKEISNMEVNLSSVLRRFPRTLEIQPIDKVPNECLSVRKRLRNVFRQYPEREEHYRDALQDLESREDQTYVADLLPDVLKDDKKIRRILRSTGHEGDATGIKDFSRLMIEVSAVYPFMRDLHDYSPSDLLMLVSDTSRNHSPKRHEKIHILDQAAAHLSNLLVEHQSLLRDLHEEKESEAA